MQTHVYANGMEIACKAAGSDGVSPQAFPDPCWSPPGPAAGPIVIPYPNTCYANSISEGTCTVSICGQEVAIEDKSYFSTSTGNEPATQAFKKGVKTGVIQGKGYFTQWSFDVIFEGFGVPRHMDLVGHNHGSMPSNTAQFPYLSRTFLGSPCSDEKTRINRACQPEKDHSNAKKDIKKHSKFDALLKLKRKEKSGVGRRDKNDYHWTDEHCDGLNIALDKADKAEAYAKEMEEAFKSLPKELDILNALENELKDMALRAGTKAAAKWGAKTALKQAAGTTLPVIGNVAMGIWSAYDAVSSVGDVTEIRAIANESLEKLEVLKRKVVDAQTITREFENFSKESPSEKLKKIQQVAASGQDLLATTNDCTRARKCNLVPYKADGVGNTFRKRDSKNPSQVESAANGGCCKGQTGHHLIPEASIEESCPNYDHDAAPTVCVEGTSQYLGSHKRIHEALAGTHRHLAANGKVSQDGTMSMDSALNAAAESHREAFPLSRCSKQCIRAQLDSYYRSCKNARPKMLNEHAKQTIPSTGNTSR